MKKYLTPMVLLTLCVVLVLSSCAKNAIKEPEVLKKELEESGATVFVYSPSDTAKYKSMANLFGLEDMSGVKNVLIAEGGEDKNTARPLIIFYCTGIEATNKVFESAKGSLGEIAKFIDMKTEEECNLMKLDNCVLVGHAEMIEKARSVFG